MVISYIQFIFRAKNLEGWSHSSKIIQRSVTLFNDLAGG